MRIIDQQAWVRQKHFAMFHQLGWPYLNLCADVFVEQLRAAAQARKQSFMLMMTYVASRAANAQVEFRYRIRGDSVVEHTVVHPSPTFPVADDLFSFCVVDYAEPFGAFMERAAAQIARRTASPSLVDEAGQDNLLFMTSLPWVSFTNITHAVPLNPPDSIPRIAWGRFTAQDGRLRMPLSVQVHHGLADGLHIARFYQAVQGLLDAPEQFLDT